MRRLVTMAVAATLLIGAASPDTATAERRSFTDRNGWSCEINMEESLAKLFCFNPRDRNDWSACLVEFQPDRDRVFLDCWSEARVVNSAEMTTREFLDLTN